MIRRLTLATAVLLTACGSSTTEPDANPWLDEQRLYVLLEMAGEPLPRVATTSPGGTFRFLADTLLLEPDGTGLQVTRVSVEHPGSIAHEERWVAQFRYEVHGDRFELAFVCPPDQISSCIAPPHYRGEFVGATLRLDQALGYPVPLVYERKGGPI